jgi:hypothetical protein
VTRTLWAGLGAAAALLVTSCSSSTTDYRQDAVKAIESETQRTLGLGELTATCDEPSSKDVGTTFACTATTADDQTVTLNAQIQSGKQVSVQPTNVLIAETLATIEGDAARVLKEQTGVPVTAENIDCGTKPVVAQAGKPFVCALFDSASPNVVFDVSITLNDLTSPSDLAVEVASAPRD